MTVALHHLYPFVHRFQHPELNTPISQTVEKVYELLLVGKNSKPSWPSFKKAFYSYLSWFRV
jgi:hypothetical protein